MPNISELIIILLVVFVLFGASRIPEAGRALGEGIRNFKKGLSGEEEKPKLENKEENDAVHR
ncbi:twin-arginine translocase TatA/TatE family subunit [Hydrogenivirga sp.]